MFMFRNRSVGIYNRSFIQSSIKSTRFNSTSASTSSPLSWVEFFKLKKSNNRLNTATSVVTGLGGALITLTYLGNIEIDVEKPIMGLDPFMVLGGAIILGGGVGYLLGPFIGTSAFNAINKKSLSQFKIKDKVFLSKIKNNRVDPSSQSFSNPVPDYYGERIYSLKDYKQWLRDCNAFKRKSKEFL